MAWLGCIADYVTTQIGTQLCGLIETHPQYNPLIALAIFTCSIAVLDLTLPKRTRWNIAILTFSTLSWLGAINNILVLLGIFNGLNLHL